MSVVETEPKVFEPGTTGWSAHDLDDPAIEALWEQGRYEIIEGVLAILPPAYFAPHADLGELMFELHEHYKRQGLSRGFAQHVDIVIDEERVVRADAVYLTANQKIRQAQAARVAGKPNPRKARIYVPPTLIVESMSIGHEHHDRVTKRRWYAEFGVPHYWLLDTNARSLELLILHDGAYQREALGRDDALLHPSLFPGLELKLSEIWSDE